MGIWLLQNVGYKTVANELPFWNTSLPALPIT